MSGAVNSRFCSPNRSFSRLRGQDAGIVRPELVARMMFGGALTDIKRAASVVVNRKLKGWDFGVQKYRMWKCRRAPNVAHDPRCKRSFAPCRAIMLLVRARLDLHRVLQRRMEAAAHERRFQFAANANAFPPPRRCGAIRRTRRLAHVARRHAELAAERAGEV
jgi:hypothetical protein